ncbi:hypothetical protein B0H13DRAFT_2229589 [Mycena leptocephala]|nr:hypothetical protein B0H13DRAFT_2229589 [Mycena leptocephala]
MTSTLEAAKHSPGGVSFGSSESWYALRSPVPLSSLFGTRNFPAEYTSSQAGLVAITGLQPLAVNSLDPLSSVNGTPTASFRDNLRSDTKYITSWANDVISIMNLIYLGLITDRVPVLPVFLPSHYMLNSYGDEHSPLPFGITVMDDIGCWNVGIYPVPRQSSETKLAPWFLKLDISYTKTPAWIKMKQNFEHDRYSSFWSLASLAFPSTRAANLVPPLPTKQTPAWRFVGQHMRWTTRLERLADEYLRRAFGLQQDDPIPPFISIHVRHNDFKDWCESDVSPDECFAPLSAIQRRVREVQEEIMERKGIEVEHVIMTSDEKKQHLLGWLGVDHTRTKELYGHWHTILIDAVIQSKSAGFVGTARSTVSVLANKRVGSWQDGPVRMVKWGKPGADDH